MSSFNNNGNNNYSNNNRMPVIEIDDDIIDLDGQEKTPEEVVYEWDAKIRKQLTNHSIVDNENIIVEFMREYLKSAEDMARNYDENDSFRRKLLCHTAFFYSYFTELKCCITDNYLDIMEDILTLYCNIELKIVRLLKRKDSNKREYKRRIASVCRRIIHMITVYLLEKTDHMLHVLIKLNYNYSSESCIKILNVLYRHFLTEVPVTNFNDESFCRTYILFQKWKQIRKTEEWQTMDETMYKMYKRNADSIRTNDTLKRILMPTCQSTVDVLLQLFRPIRDISDAYFKHIKEKKNIEIEDLDFNIDLGEDDLNPTIDENKENDSDDDDVEFMRAYEEVEQNMSTFGPQIKIKHEKDDDEDEVVFVSYTNPTIKQPKIQDLFITEEDSQSSNSLSSNKSKESTTNSDNDNPPTPSTIVETAVQPDPVEITSDIQSSRLETSPALPPPPSPLPLPSPSTTVKMCSVATSTENLPDSNSISDSCVNNNDNNSYNNINNDISDNTSERKIVKTRTVEVQANEQTINKNCLYSYGLVTPPSDVPTDDHNTRTIETCVYTHIMSTKQNLQDDNIRSSIEEQDEEITENETPVQESEDTSEDLHDDIEDYRENPDRETVMKDIKSDRFDNISKTIEVNDNVQNSIETEDYEINTTTTISNEIQSETTEITNSINCNGDIDEIETNSSSDHISHDDNEPICNHFEGDVTTDTGQINENSNIDNVENKTKSKDLSNGASSKTLEPVNGNTLIKPLNSTQNGHNKILFTSTQTIHNTTLEEFSKFEDNLNWNKTHDNDFDDVLSGPISKMSLNKNHQLINDEKLDFFNTTSDIVQTKTNNQHVVENSSRSNSPNEMLSPAFETIDDFRIQDFYNNDGPIVNVNSSVNRLSNTTESSLSSPTGVVSSTNHGILKKTPGMIKKKTQISFGENTLYNFHSDEKRTRSSKMRDLLKNDKKLRMDLRVNLQRLPFIENTMKRVVESARMIRVDYDKTTTYINKNDIVRCVSPPPLSWTYRSFDSGRERHNSGNIDLYNSNNLSQLSNIEDKALNLTVPSNETDPNPVDYKPSFSSLKTIIPSTPNNDVVTEKNETEINVKPPSPTPLYSSDLIKIPEFPKQDTSTPLISPEVNSFNGSVSDYVKTPSPAFLHESEFSNSPKFLQNTDQILQSCLEEPSREPCYVKEEIDNHKSSFLSNNSNFYISEIINDKNSNLESCKIKISKVNFKTDNSINNSKNFDEKSNENSIPLPTAVPETYDFEKNLKNEVFSKIDWQTLEDFDFEETRLPLKKRKLSVAHPLKEDKLIEKPKKEEISYPATPMISIAEVEDLHLRKLQSLINHNDNNINIDNNQSNSRPFKTPAERKEMPPLPVFYSNNNSHNSNNNTEPSPIITDQFNINNHTYNNPTINYHMSNVPFLNIPCGSYYSLPSFLVPINTVSSAPYETAKNLQLQETNYIKKEARKQSRRKRT